MTYLRKDWLKIKLAYCISIHKAQGSEFKLVILPLVRQYRRMLNRNLLYTAVTRAKSLLVLLGEPVAYQEAVAHLAVNRQTSLQQRIGELIKPIGKVKKQTELTLETKVVAEEKGALKPSSAKKDVTELDAPKDGNFRLTAELIVDGQIDPLIGMNGITPTDFQQVINCQDQTRMDIENS